MLLLKLVLAFENLFIFLKTIRNMKSSGNFDIGAKGQKLQGKKLTSKQEGASINVVSFKKTLCNINITLTVF